jgi:putative metal-binding protein
MQWWRLGVPLLALSCGNRFAPNPFPSQADTPDAGGAGGPSEQADGGRLPPFSTPRELLGGPCVDDAQCDDGIDCTYGSCDTALGLCRFVADDDRCSDGIFCNGVERCDPRTGCRTGPPTSCSDATPCTIDSCDEATRSCVRVQRDVDGDGDVDGNCQPGGDCNDLDPLVGSSAPELCGNQRDDDCDGEVDEAGCQQPRFDTCEDALQIDAPGSYVLSGAGAQVDYGESCATPSPALRELVVSLVVPAGDPRDVEVVARSLQGNIALSHPESCGGSPSPGQCAQGAPSSSGVPVARLHLSSPPPGVQTLYVYTDVSSPLQLDVSEEPASAATTNTSCEERLPLEPSTSTEVDLAISGDPLESACPVERGDRFFEFTLDATSDVQLVAESIDGFGQPRISLRRAECLGLDEELRCNQREVASVRVRALPAGTYVVALSASGPTRARLNLEVQAPSTAPPQDRCDTAPALPLNQTQSLGFDELEDDIAAGCSAGSVDSANRLELTSDSDVLLIARFSRGDVGAVSFAQASCLEAGTLACTRTTDQLARLSRRGVASGEYRVVTESLLGLPATLLAAVRPASAPTLVARADTCADALTIDEAGGFFQGNTSNAVPDYSAGCDFATPAGAPEQMLHLVLSAPRRVVLDMRGSDFDTLLDVRRGPECPGEEVAGGCAVFVGGDRSFLDLNLPAGDYFIQIDGYAGASGNWFLNVFVLEP